MALAAEQRASRRISSRAWERMQIELNGQYSLKRMEALREYADRTSVGRAAAVIMLTPVPCLLIIVLADSYPLAPPTDGADKNGAFWIRLTITVVIFCFAMIEQFHGILGPHLPISRRPLIVVVTFVSTISVMIMYWIALAVGFPIPFMCWTVSIIWAPLLLIALAVMWRKHLWGKDSQFQHVVGNFRACVVVALSQMCLICTYPAYVHVFNRLPSQAQTVFSLGLPLIKMITKNVMSRSMTGLDDHKPEMVTLTVEIFHALFVSYCTQVSLSVYTVGILIGVDVVHSFLSLYDVWSLLKHKDGHKPTDSIPTSGPSDRSLVNKVTARSLGPAPLIVPKNVGSTRGLPPSSAVVAPGGPETENTQDSKPPAADPQTIQTLRVLYLTEFLVLIEYIEVIIPCIYSLYLILMPRLPNSAYYPQLVSMTTDSAGQTIGNLLLYACLELISFIALDRILTRRLQIAPIHQLAFVLEGNWKMVQSKIIPWVFFLVQSSLVHFGVDYSFQFEWLRKPAT